MAEQVWIETSAVAPGSAVAAFADTLNEGESYHACARRHAQARANAAGTFAAASVYVGQEDAPRATANAEPGIPIDAIS